MNWNSLELIEADLIAWRRHLHMNPELSFQEQKTSHWIAEKLRLWGISVKTGVAGHGIIARLSGKKVEPSNRKSVHVALRADIDALPIQDEKDVFYKSRVPGVMHACGHDGHTATLLGVAWWLANHPEQWSGEVTLLFQPAEEVNPGGALSLIDAGALDGVDCIYGVHLWTPLPVGIIGSCPGAMLASVDEFTIDIQGRGGHAALPHQTVDSVVVGAQLVQSLQTIVSRSIDPLDHAVVTIGSFHAGHTFNVIAERAQLKGTVRSFQSKTRELAEQRLNQLVEHTVQMFGAQADVKYNRGYPSVINHHAHVLMAEQACRAYVPEVEWNIIQPVMAGEDFAYYLQKVPGCFLFVGAGNPQTGSMYPHHHPRFNIDESAMIHAAKLLIGLTLQAKD